MNEAPVSPKDIESTKIEYAIDLVVLFCPKLLSFKNVEVVLDINLGGGVIIARRIVPGPSSKMSFVDVPVTEDGVETASFLDASEGLCALFDHFNAAAFGPVQSDLHGNIAKVRTRLNSHPSESATLEKLVANEKKESKQPATEGLMWLLRGLAFTCKALQHCQADQTAELTAGFNKSYPETLKPYHNFVVKGVFAVALKACPYRKDFYTKIGSPPDDQLNAWLGALDAIVTRMDAFYKAGGHGEVYKA
ncbi:Glycolipid transfer protein (GLTP) [Rhizoctonia solani]|uniref:Glycolipid transfer protein (GLTP) n=1 Tax=Rhizoctonia solani TaxID=456999 RepID=A0A8H7M3L8_9AGAM|nr:Glycolipid transfer protein (GLTP) [Rhizoctonia solani]